MRVDWVDVDSTDPEVGSEEEDGEGKEGDAESEQENHEEDTSPPLRYGPPLKFGPPMSKIAGPSKPRATGNVAGSSKPRSDKEDPVGPARPHSQSTKNNDGKQPEAGLNRKAVSTLKKGQKTDGQADEAPNEGPKPQKSTKKASSKKRKPEEDPEPQPSKSLKTEQGRKLGRRTAAVAVEDSVPVSDAK